MSNRKKIDCDIQLMLEGMGIALYSPGNMKGIEEGTDYFNKEFSTPDKVSKHIQKGDITGFCTGSGGNYIVKIRSGYPSLEITEKYPISIRLALDVKGGKICIIDLLWLMEWSEECPAEQEILVEDGIYHVTVLTIKPISEIWGDQQEVYIY